ncbi:hypothetical protein GIB67_028809, partial [Kingdonia uniflora]
MRSNNLQVFDHTTSFSLNQVWKSQQMADLSARFIILTKHLNRQKIYPCYNRAY